MARISGMRWKIISCSSGGRAALYHQAEATKKASGASSHRAQKRTMRVRSRSSRIQAAVMSPNSPAMIRAKKVRNESAGQKVGLKNPDQKFRSSGQVPGVSMKSMTPLMRNSDIQAAPK